MTIVVLARDPKSMIQLPRATGSVHPPNGRRVTATPGRVPALPGQASAHDSNLGFSSRAIHAGQEPDPTTGAVVPPIHQVSTYKQDGIGGLRGGYEYSRVGQPDPHRARGVHRGAGGR